MLVFKASGGKIHEGNASIGEGIMYGKDRIYKKLEIIGVSHESIEAAIQAALTKAHKTLQGLSWFEVQDVRGHVGEDGKVTEYQVVLKVAFELKD